jgi:hypothetical protein
VFFPRQSVNPNGIRWWYSSLTISSTYHPWSLPVSLAFMSYNVVPRLVSWFITSITHVIIPSNSAIQKNQPQNQSWLVVWNICSIQLGISSSQLTNSNIFQRGGSTTNQITCFDFVYWQDRGDIIIDDGIRSSIRGAKARWWDIQPATWRSNSQQMPKFLLGDHPLSKYWMIFRYSGAMGIWVMVVVDGLSKSS